MWLEVVKMIVAGIDVGLVNLGFCVANTETGSMFIEKMSLLETKSGKKYKYKEGDIEYYISNFINDRKNLFDSIDLLVIECQMQRKFLIIQHSIKAMLYDKMYVYFLSPLKLKNFFGTSNSNYAKNKDAAVAKCKSILNPSQLNQFNKYKKQDDIADSVLMTIYAGLNYDKIVDELELPKSIESIKVYKKAAKRAKKRIREEAKVKKETKKARKKRI